LSMVRIVALAATNAVAVSVDYQPFLNGNKVTG